MTTARDIMHPGVECIGENETLTEAARRMRDMDVGSLPICDENGELHGIVTDRDIVVRCCAEGRDPARVKAGAFADEELHAVAAGDDGGTVVRTMAEHQIRRVPVMDGGRVVGMISEADLAHHLPDADIADFVENVYRPTRASHT